MTALVGGPEETRLQYMESAAEQQNKLAVEHSEFHGQADELICR